MNFNYYLPEDPAIKNIIHSIWQVDHFHSFKEEYIIPKGVVEIIFDFSNSAPISAQMNNVNYNLPRCFLNGFNTSPVQLQLPKQQVFLGVVFQPFAVKKIFGYHAYEFSDLTVDLTHIDSSFQSLWHQLIEQVQFNSRVKIISNWLIRNVIDLNPQERLINYFLYDVNQHSATVKELSDTLCYSSRHLSRKMYEVTGMNTEEILVYKKYLHAVHLIHKTDLPLTAIAYQSQFSDQSHFIRSFKQYTKMTPGEYQRNKSGVIGHIHKDVR